MPKLLKIVLLLAVATAAIAAVRVNPPGSPETAALNGASISPNEIMRAAGQLPETKVDHYW